nr:MAG TPA: hypothetical protein [Caudoviricetes sp.]
MSSYLLCFNCYYFLFDDTNVRYIYHILKQKVIFNITFNTI